MEVMTHESIRRAGRYRGLSCDGVDKATVMKLLRHMLRVRRCEEALIKEYHVADEIRCPVHFCVGQEAVSAALSVLLTSEDYLFSHHRSHGYYFAKHGSLDAFFAELYGKETGACGGKGGSQDIAVPDVRFYSGAILAGAIAIASGAAYTLQQQKSKNIAVTGFGEASTEEGVFWETINYAAVNKLPMVFSCENNKYSTFSPQLYRQPADNLRERVESFGMPAVSIFGNDVLEVYRTFKGAVEKARSGGGPTFIQSYTYRWNGHVGPENDDVIGYRDPEEIRFWKDNCPIKLLRETLEEKRTFDAGQYDRWVEEIDAEIAAAFAFAKASPFPRNADWQTLNYATHAPMASRLLADVEAVGFDQNQAEAIPGPY